jgi:hypothetical protein
LGSKQGAEEGRTDLGVRIHLDPVLDEETAWPVDDGRVPVHYLGEDLLPDGFVLRVHCLQPQVPMLARSREQVGDGVVAGREA